jgi:hypothetical protein
MVFQSPLFDKETPYAPEPESALLERGFRGESWKLDLNLKFVVNSVNFV